MAQCCLPVPLMLNLQPLSLVSVFHFLGQQWDLKKTWRFASSAGKKSDLKQRFLKNREEKGKRHICEGVLIFFSLAFFGYKFTLVIQPIYKPQLQQPEKETGYNPLCEMLIIFPRSQGKTPFICILFQMLFSFACHFEMGLTVAKRLQEQQSQKSSVSSQNKFTPDQPCDLPLQCPAL